MWFTSTKDGAVNANTYRIGLDGTGMKRLTRDDGRHAVTWNDERSMFLDRFSSLGAAPHLRLCDAEGEVTADANPNGAVNNIAGIVNEAGNVFGLMPHPEHAVEPAIGGVDGIVLLGSLIDAAHGGVR